MPHRIRTPLEEVEARATYTQVFDPAGIPPLLWTPDYAWHALTGDHTVAEHRASLRKLHRRQQALLSGRTNYAFIFPQRALPAPTTAANRGQLGRILSLEGQARVMVITDCCPLLHVTDTAFTIYSLLRGDDEETSAVGITIAHSDFTITAPDQVTQYRALFTHMAVHATDVRDRLHLHIR
jgi:hypothetical protein